MDQYFMHSLQLTVHNTIDQYIIYYYTYYACRMHTHKIISKVQREKKSIHFLLDGV